MARDDGRSDRTWIGQHPDENTDAVHRELDEGAERVAVTNNTPADPEASTDSNDAPQVGHREPKDER